MKNIVISPNITNREYPSLDKYFNEIEKIAPVKPEEEVILAEKIRLGDYAALERLTTANLRFVITVAKQYQHMGLTLGDLINEGNLGLIIAAKRYDETKGFKFISYAVWWIRQSIITALADHARTVRLPYNKLMLMTRVYKAISVLEQKYGRKPDPSEVAEYIGVPVYHVSDALKRSYTGLSLYEPAFNDEEFSPIDYLPHTGAGTDDQLMLESIKAEISDSMQVLSPREREILILYYGLGQLPAMNLIEISKRYNITKEHTGRLKDQALKKLRNCTHAPVLQSCLN
jgi:RNA polymerase primary sigma factor